MTAPRPDEKKAPAEKTVDAEGETAVRPEGFSESFSNRGTREATRTRAGEARAGEVRAAFLPGQIAAVRAGAHGWW